MRPKGIKNTGMKGYKTGVNGYSGISVFLTATTQTKTVISESVEVNNPLSNPTQTITESVLVSIT